MRVVLIIPFCLSNEKSIYKRNVGTNYFPSSFPLHAFLSSYFCIIFAEGKFDNQKETVLKIIML